MSKRMKRFISFSIIAYILGVSVFFFLAAGAQAFDTSSSTQVVRENDDGNFTVERVKIACERCSGSVMYRIVDRELNTVCYTKSGDRSGMSCLRINRPDLSDFDRTTRHKVISE